MVNDLPFRSNGWYQTTSPKDDSRWFEFLKFTNESQASCSPACPSALPLTPCRVLPAVKSNILTVLMFLFFFILSMFNTNDTFFLFFFFFFEQMNSLFSIKQGIQDMNWKVNLIKKKKTRKGKMNKASPASVNHYWIYFFYKREGGDKEM